MTFDEMESSVEEMRDGADGLKVDFEMLAKRVESLEDATSTHDLRLDSARNHREAQDRNISKLDDEMDHFREVLREQSDFINRILVKIGGVDNVVGAPFPPEFKDVIEEAKCVTDMERRLRAALIEGRRMASRRDKELRQSYTDIANQVTTIIDLRKEKERIAKERDRLSEKHDDVFAELHDEREKLREWKSRPAELALKALTSERDDLLRRVEALQGECVSLEKEVRNATDEKMAERNRNGPLMQRVADLEKERDDFADSNANLAREMDDMARAMDESNVEELRQRLEKAETESSMMNEALLKAAHDLETEKTKNQKALATAKKWRKRLKSVRHVLGHGSNAD